MFCTNHSCTIAAVVLVLQSLELTPRVNTHKRQMAREKHKSSAATRAQQHSLCTQNTKERTFPRGPTLLVHNLKTTDFAPKKIKNPTLRKVNIVTGIYEAFKTEIILNTCPVFC